MVLKGYFDGARQPDRTVIATACGTGDQWDNFKTQWDEMLCDNKADFLHTTDAVALQEDFAVGNGWTDTRVDAFIEDCVSVIKDHIYNPQRLGLFVATLTIRIEDFLKARQTVPTLPNTVEEICATESLSFCFKWGRSIGSNYYHLYYDQGEPFYGHVDNRMRHKKARRAIPLLNKAVVLAQANMRVTPALQMADLFAWCISHNNQVSRSWHNRLNDLYWNSLGLDYPHLPNPKKGVLEIMASWKFPRRRPTRLIHQ